MGRWAIGAGLLALGCSACGAQVVSWTIDANDSGSSAGVASSGPPVDAGAMLDSTTTDSSPYPGGGPSYGHHDASTVACLATCSAPMGACMSDNDCCQGGRCLQHLCEPPMCVSPGMPCSYGAPCCSGRCEPGVGNGPPTCAQYCAPDSKPCMKASDCCSLACNDGTCGGALCGRAGAACQADSGCCSDACIGNRCAVSSDSCLASGESCGDGGINCCSGTCNTDTKLCSAAGYSAAGYGTTCLPRNAPCSRDNFSIACCENENGFGAPAALTCSLASATATVPTCQGCNPDGQRCATNVECCTNICNDAGLCGQPTCVSQQ